MNKYRNVKVAGFDSAKEHRRFVELQLLERAGVISDLRRQTPWELIPKQDGERAVMYRSDFDYWEDGKLVVEDVKSEFTRKLPAYILKRKLLLWIHKIRIRET